MAEIVRQQSGNHKVVVGCFETQGAQKPLGTQPLYGCIDLETNTPEAFGFHYSWRGHSNISKRVNQVLSITKRSGLLTLQFKNGSTVIRDGLRAGVGSSFNPKDNCKITKEQDEYTLTCGTGTKPFTQKVKSDAFHKPTSIKI